MISHEHECIFIHIPKTAGTSIEKKLGHFTHLKTDVQDHRTIRELEPFRLAQLGSLVSGKDRYLARRFRNRIKGAPRVNPDQYRDYFKFTFVRNTFSRVFSWYRNVMTNQSFLSQRRLKEEVSFHDFLLRFPEDWGLRSQLFWIEDSRGNLPFDFIGRFESLESDFMKVGQELGLPDPVLPKLVVGEGLRYADHYDSRTIQMVKSRYQREIELFEFEFEH